MTATSESMAAALDRVIADVPGVTALYRTGGLLGQAVAAGKELLRPERESIPYVQLTDSGAHPSITVTIGVDERSATETCRLAYDTILTWLRANGHTDAAVSITVAHVTG
ncbi:hypothetical protein GCM10022288_20890 [Gryllotalpicola kribbensis]|uniref:Asp23/Gls24 family envelope stress response protein n=1 Tax=Gryllotalpicola kribbensis TaxID=993084 RepID=A0ABP8AUJ6_9MICO